ncbi:hypothetical protein VB773_19780 [Haloarculaceae archaeon H-GB2-1]|nr:hypothetical protein [Haloarculaceae archaeon H-GB2-1]
MSELLPVRPEDQIAPEIQEEIENIASKLRVDVQVTIGGSGLRIRQEGCTDALELAEDKSAAARRLTPLLVTVLREECNRTYADTMDKTYRALSERAERAAAETLSTVAGEALLDAYEHSTYELEMLLEDLVTILEAERTTAAKQSTLIVLAELSKERPEQLALHSAEVVSTVIDVLSDSQDQESIRPGTRLLALVATRHPDAIAVDQSDVQRAIDTIARTDDYSAQANLLLVVNQIAVSVPSESVTEIPEADSFADVIVSLAESSRSNHFLQLVTIMSVAPPALCETAVDDLATKVHNTDGKERRRAAEALGEVVAATGSTIARASSHWPPTSTTPTWEGADGLPERWENSSQLRRSPIASPSKHWPPTSTPPTATSTYGPLKRWGRSSQPERSTIARASTHWPPASTSPTTKSAIGPPSRWENLSQPRRCLIARASKHWPPASTPPTATSAGGPR